MSKRTSLKLFRNFSRQTNYFYTMPIYYRRNYYITNDAKISLLEEQNRNYKKKLAQANNLLCKFNYNETFYEKDKKNLHELLREHRTDNIETIKQGCEKMKSHIKMFRKDCEKVIDGFDFDEEFSQNMNEKLKELKELESLYDELLNQKIKKIELLNSELSNQKN